MADREPIKGANMFYMWRLQGIQERCRELGYCVAVHGSLNYDLDLVAIPWVEDAVDEQTLIQAICDFIGGPCADLGSDKPHGRRAYIISFGGGPHIDLSVLPRHNQEQKS